jgi:hypothetical protein
MAPEPISTAYFINPSHQSVCLYVHPSIVARQKLGKHVPAETYIRNNRRIVRGVVFYTVRVVSKKILWVCLRIPLLLLGNGSVNTFPGQRKIVGSMVFYAVHFVSKESRRLVLSITSCSIPLCSNTEFCSRFSIKKLVIKTTLSITDLHLLKGFRERFEVLTVMTMKIAILWGTVLCCLTDRFSEDRAVFIMRILLKRG